MNDKSEYHIIIDDGDVVVDCNTYELTYAHNGEVMTIGGCMALAEGGCEGFKETWLSQKVREE